MQPVRKNLFEQLHEHRFLCVQPVFRFVENFLRVRLEHLVLYLLSAVRGQAVQNERVGLGERHDFFAYAVIFEDLFPLRFFRFLPIDAHTSV